MPSLLGCEAIPLGGDCVDKVLYVGSYKAAQDGAALDAAAVTSVINCAAFWRRSTSNTWRKDMIHDDVAYAAALAKLDLECEVACHFDEESFLGPFAGQGLGIDLDTLQYCRLYLSDCDDMRVEPIDDAVERALQFVRDAPPAAAILVHCHMGVSRSAAVACYIVGRLRGLSYDAALAVIRDAWPRAKPNVSYASQLRALLQ